jgi:hypothetical protein
VREPCSWLGCKSLCANAKRRKVGGHCPTNSAASFLPASRKTAEAKIPLGRDLLHHAEVAVFALRQFVHGSLLHRAFGGPRLWQYPYHAGCCRGARQLRSNGERDGPLRPTAIRLLQLRRPHATPMGWAVSGLPHLLAALWAGASAGGVAQPCLRALWSADRRAESAPLPCLHFAVAARGPVPPLRRHPKE